MGKGWEGSTRRTQLPPDWEQRREHVLKEAGRRCTITMANGSRCRDKATEVDHIQPGPDHSYPNLRAICSWHHKRKSSAEGNAARKRHSNKHPKEPHPGLETR